MVVPGDIDGNRGGQMRGIGGDVGSLALGSDDQPGGRLDLDLDMESQSQGQDVEPWSEVGS